MPKMNTEKVGLKMKDRFTNVIGRMVDL